MQEEILFNYIIYFDTELIKGIKRSNHDTKISITIASECIGTDLQIYS